MKNANLFFYILASAVITILCGLIYVTTQQSYRTAANDPQLQMARDISYNLENNQPVTDLVKPGTIEISKTLATFTVLYDPDGNPVQSTGVLDGQLPQIPKGVFDYTKKHGEDVITWQPRRGVRMATVVEPVRSDVIGFVVVGRSLSEVEKRVSNLTSMILLGWMASLGCILLHFLLSRIRFKNQ